MSVRIHRRGIAARRCQHKPTAVVRPPAPSATTPIGEAIDATSAAEHRRWAARMMPRIREQIAAAHQLLDGLAPEVEPARSVLAALHAELGAGPPRPKTKPKGRR